MTLFTPKGEKPEWRMIYDSLLSGVESGDTVTLDQLDDALGRTFSTNRSPLYRACRELGAARHRWLEAVPRVGYRVVEANEHTRLSRGHKRRGQRQFSTALTVLNATDLTRLNEPERDHFDTQTRVVQALVFVAVQHEARLARLETAMRAGGML